MMQYEPIMENPSEPKAAEATVAEGAIPGNPEIPMTTMPELSQEDELSKQKPLENENDLTKTSEEKPEVHFASAHTSISYLPEEEEDTLSMISILLEQFTGHFFAGLPRILSMEALIPIEYRDTFTQTFFKAMTRLSNRRFVEIINMRVDHTDPTLVFYCPSYELLTSFEDTNGMSEV